jgi:hypothetical protein
VKTSSVNLTSSIQPRTFAQVGTRYSSTTGRCICCQGTVSQLVDGDWVHTHLDALGRRDAWCRSVR